MDAIALLMQTDRTWADDRAMWALMARTAYESNRAGQRVVVFDPMYTQTVRDWRSQGADLELDLDTYTFGEMNRPDTIGIPVYHPNHWVLGIYDARSNVINYFDTLHGPLDNQTRDDMLAGVRRFYPNGVHDDGVLPRVRTVPFRAYNAQTDGINCGFHVPMLWERWLTTPEHTTFIESLSMQHERLRMINNLVDIFLGEDRPLLPLIQHARVAPLERYRASLSHYDLICRVRSAMQGTPLQSQRSQRAATHQPLPSASPATASATIPSIGQYVPYHTDTAIDAANIAAAPIRPSGRALPIEGEEEEEETDPFIAAERVEQSTTVHRYRRRARGVAKFASRRDYINFHMQRRGTIHQHHALLSYGRLTQKYLIHQAWLTYANEEEHHRRLQSTPEFRRSLRSTFIEYHQRKLQRHRQNDPNVEQQKIGKVFQMPATARQSEKNTHLNITRAMAIMKAVKPHCGMFVTYTFNCKCPEMVQMIGPNANSADYPDLCCRLSALKFREMLKVLSGPKGVLGPVKAWVWSLEYQKRGNKHWHLVLMNDPANPGDPNTPEYIDQYISAKIPVKPIPGESNYDEKLYYYNLVTSLYIHDCEDNPEAACRAGQPDNRCQFGYPKAFSERTVLHRSGVNTNVEYARPSPEQGGNTIPVTRRDGTTKVFTNQHVVPHNPALTMRMGSHVCVEFITEYSLWFYLFKYNHKLTKDTLAALYVQDPNDPNAFNVDYYNVRREFDFIGPFQAVDILRSEPWAGRSHDPMLLTVHLEGQEPFYFIAGHEEAAAKRAEHAEFRTKWTAYMKLVRDEEADLQVKMEEGEEPKISAKDLKFAEVEAHYTFHKTDERTGEYIWRFERRRRPPRGGIHIGMIYAQNPANHE
jgi:hypothetical protein